MVVEMVKVTFYVYDMLQSISILVNKLILKFQIWFYAQNINFNNIYFDINSH